MSHYPHEILMNVEKPARYVGGEFGAIMKNPLAVGTRVAFCFPDLYEIGQSNLGLQILYSVLNSMEDVWCERAFAPWNDMAEKLKSHKILLKTLESGTALNEFDIIAFSLQYELCYTNVLQMLDLGGISLRFADRKSLKNLVIGGGPCAANPEPIADFFDAFILGEGEEVLAEFTELYNQHKSAGSSKSQFLQAAAQIDGVYVPSLYHVNQNENGVDITPAENAPKRITKRIVQDLDNAHFPKNFVTPLTKITFERVVTEIFRGCYRGCRFCQAGFMNRPVRNKSSETINKQARELIKNTGYSELSLCSLSTGDYKFLPDLINKLTGWSDKSQTSISLPSLRIDNFDEDLLGKIMSVRKSTITFAPEAGSQRLRDIINKNITEKEILAGCAKLFARGISSVKLYFMLGLPFETDEDVKEIAILAKKIVDLHYKVAPAGTKSAIKISISISTFVPKPHTPFQWAAQNSIEEIHGKQQILIENISSKKIKLSWSDPQMSLLEAVFAKGDRRLSNAIETAYKSGCVFDAWGENFNFELWQKAFDECDTDPAYYANREISLEENLPWAHLDFMVDSGFLIKEYEAAKYTKTTESCDKKCSACGINKTVRCAAYD